MRIFLFALVVTVLVVAGTPARADDGAPDTVIGMMGMKLIRGVVNVATSPAELPKQVYVSMRDDGDAGLLLGPLKGIGMTVYRAFIGGVETAGFLVPQPGYYDPMISPRFVWE